MFDRIRLSVFFLSCGLLFAADAAAQQAHTVEATCSLSQIPADAVRVDVPQSPPLFHYPDPRAVPKDFSGCLNTWLEGNIRAMQARFYLGKVVWFRVGGNDVYCEYENDRVVKQVVDDSLRRKMAEAGMTASYCPPGQDLIPSRWR
jgi:hypothetical protein